jgi:predicted nucleotidyltransferase
MLADLAGLVRALADHRVRFVVIGGVAVAAHGYLRATEDLDIVPDPDRENLDRLGNALVAIDARLATDATRELGPRERQALYQGRNLTLSTTLGDVDVVQRLAGVPGFAELFADSQEASIGGVPIAVSSRDHLIAMKAARGSAQDRADLERLQRPDA